MLKSILKIGVLGLLATAIVGLPVQALAQNTNTPSTAKKQRAHGFHGKLAGVDTTAKTITVGETTYQISSQTRIMKAGKAATLEDGVVGEDVSGSARPNEDGKMVALNVYFGPRPEPKRPMSPSTNAPPTTSK
ncbi:conserved exported hypothetical protein [Verrucomicrobia bacterium]|nr:conserved exported hypothetical protein [Verrucomicrobiota bacterium]